MPGAAGSLRPASQPASSQPRTGHIRTKQAPNKLHVSTHEACLSLYMLAVHLRIACDTKKGHHLRDSHSSRKQFTIRVTRSRASRSRETARASKDQPTVSRAAARQQANKQTMLSSHRIAFAASPSSPPGPVPGRLAYLSTPPRSRLGLQCMRSSQD